MNRPLHPLRRRWQNESTTAISNYRESGDDKDIGHAAATAIAAAERNPAGAAAADKLTFKKPRECMGVKKKQKEKAEQPLLLLVLTHTCQATFFGSDST